MRAHRRGAAIVLTYHHVADLVSDPQLLAIDVQRFDDHVRLLSEAHNTMTFGTLLDLMSKRGRIPDRTVVVTFDDGYADTLLLALPILAEHHVPATVFVSSDYVGASREFWWDEIERVVLLAPSLPSRIEIAADDATYSAESRPTEAEDAPNPAQAQAWDITKPPTTERQRLYVEICDFMLRLRASTREAALESLRTQFGAAPLVRATHRPLSSSEVRELSDGGLVEVGAHARSHQLLSARTDAEQEEEIVGSKQDLEQICDCKIDSFSYPYGGEGAYSSRTERIVREAGFLGACTTKPGIVVPWMDRFAIPRFPSENISGSDFAKRVDRWFEVAR